MRNERSRPLMVALEAWLREQRTKLSGQSNVSKAIAYCLTRWVALTRFLDDGRLCMSNNAAEREIRPIAVGRHNWTFAGSDEGGRRAAEAVAIGPRETERLPPLVIARTALLRRSKRLCVSTTAASGAPRVRRLAGLRFHEPT